jgi:hypothetical protein
MLHRFTDSDCMGSTVYEKITFEFFFSLDSTVICSSRKQDCIVNSTAEAESIAAVVPSIEEMCLTKLLSYLFSAEREPIVIHCENHSYIKLSENLIIHNKWKHIEIRYHYVSDMVEKNILSI